MSHTYTSLVYHAVFSTKNRQRFVHADLKPQLLGYIRGILRNLGAQPIALDGVEDHIHICFAAPAALSVATAINKIKSNSTRWVRQEKREFRFGWQSGYGAFTVSQSQMPKVISYIDHQEEHHRRIPFDDELRSLLRKHGIQFDDTY